MYCTLDKKHLTKKLVNCCLLVHEEVLTLTLAGLLRALQARLEIFGCFLASSLVP